MSDRVNCYAACKKPTDNIVCQSSLRWPKVVVSLLLFLMVYIAPGDIIAQTGTVFGEVSEADRQESLPGATVLIQGTTTGTTTDIDGRFVLRRVPVGNHVIEVRYIGFQTREFQITVSENERLELNVELTGDLIEGDEVLVIGYQRGQSRALTVQRESVNIRSVVSSEQIDRFTDQTVSGALSRIAGMGHGGANIRGLGASMSNVTMDGQRMGSTGSGDRSVDLNTISSDMVQQLEVIKVITPDMDADALSGVINISTRRPIGGERSFDARLGGGTNFRFAGMGRPDSRISFSYGDSPSRQFSYGLNLSYQQSTSYSESVITDWHTRNFGEGPVDVLSYLRNELRTDPSQRYGSGVQLTFQPTDRTTFHVQGMFNYFDRERVSHGTRFDPRAESYVSPYETGPFRGYGGRITYNGEQVDYDIYQYTLRAGARHLFQKFDMEYALGWGHGRSSSDWYLFNFRSDPLYDFIINPDNRWEPTIEVAEWGPLPRFPSASDLPLYVVDHRWFHSVDNEFRASTDFNFPLDFGSLRFGSSALMTFKKGMNERYWMEFNQRINLGQFERRRGVDNWNLFDREHQTYHIPWLIDLQKAREWYYTMYPLFNMDMETWASSTETSKYDAQEHVLAGYGMATLKWNRFTLLGGARLEHSITRYEGRDGSINPVGRFVGARDISSKNSYTHLFPNAQFVFSIARFTNFRLAYSRSIGRPDFTQLNPYVMRRYDSENLSEGNPNLKPMVSHNIDLLFEHYFLNVGQFTTGFYYKELTDFVYRYRELIGPDGLDGQGAYSGWMRSSFRNGDEATVYGFEISWQQFLDFLPGFLGNLGTFANYSYTYSRSDVDRRDTDGNIIYARLQGQRPHVLNLGLDYTQRGFSTQLSYQWASAAIASYGNPRWVPEIQLQERVYFDRYTDVSSNLSLAVRYRLTSHFRIWMDVSNILNSRRIDYFYDRNFYPYNLQTTGVRMSMGIRYSL